MFAIRSLGNQIAASNPFGASSVLPRLKLALQLWLQIGSTSKLNMRNMSAPFMAMARQWAMRQQIGE